MDIVKIWVDDRDGKYKKLTPALYGAVIDEAHKQNVRVTAHLFTLEDGKGLLKAGLDAFAHGVRDRDIDDEFVKMIKARPDIILVPNLPDRGCRHRPGLPERIRARGGADETAGRRRQRTSRGAEGVRHPGAQPGAG